MENQPSKSGKPCNCRRGTLLMFSVLVVLTAAAVWLLIGQYNSYVR